MTDSTRALELARQAIAESGVPEYMSKFMRELEEIAAQELRDAFHDADSALNVLSMAAQRGPRAKPTVAELNDVMAKLRNVRAFLASAMEDK